MYTVIIYNYPNHETKSFEFTNIREALSSFIERCETLGYPYREDNNGNFLAGGIGNDYSIELISHL